MTWQPWWRNQSEGAKQEVEEVWRQKDRLARTVETVKEVLKKIVKGYHTFEGKVLHLKHLNGRS